MEDVVRRARAAGLLCHAGGYGMREGRPEWPDLFDAVVLSGLAGVAKPDTAAYALVARRPGVAPARCVFVDDLRPNVLGAAAAGMTGVHHLSVAATLGELEVLIFAV